MNQEVPNNVSLSESSIDLEEASESLESDLDYVDKCISFDESQLFASPA